MNQINLWNCIYINYNILWSRNYFITQLLFYIFQFLTFLRLKLLLCSFSSSVDQLWRSTDNFCDTKYSVLWKYLFRKKSKTLINNNNGMDTTHSSKFTSLSPLFNIEVFILCKVTKNLQNFPARCSWSCAHQNRNNAEKDY